MAKVFDFRPRKELDAEANLQEFVRYARDELTTFGSDLLFADNCWDISDHVVSAGRPNHRIRLRFSQIEGGLKKNFVAMREPFLSFAKAYVRFQQAHSPINMLASVLAALRVLEAALAASGKPPNPVDAGPGVFNRAAGILTEHNGDQHAYKAARQLERISAFLIEYRLVTVRLPWTSFVDSPVKVNERVGPEFDRRRQTKLPSQAALTALPQIYRKATHPGDILGSAVAALLLCAPSRISELLSLPLQCEHRARDPETGEELYGLRWWPAKGADPMLKWVIPSMQFLAKDALKKVRTVTEPARALARWYENNPDKLYLPNDLEHLRKREHLTLTEVSEILGLKRLASAWAWCKAKKIEQQRRQGLNWIQFDDVERHVLKDLPKGFPFLPGTGMRFQDALFVFRKQEIGSHQSTSACCFAPVSYRQIELLLGSKSVRGARSIFSNHGFFEPDGGPIELKTHQLRRYLNTLAQQGGLSQLDIAKWSGRKDIRQNETYDYETSGEILEKIRDAIGDDAQMVGPLANLPDPLPISREEFASERVPTAMLTTDAGVCIHDWSMLPCQHHRHCIDCEDHVYEKTPKTLARIRALRDDALSLLRMAEKAAQEPIAGVNRWIEKQRATYKRYQAVHTVIDDPNVQEGTFVQLPTGEKPPP